MKFKEPIKKRCPACRGQLVFSLEWILREGQVCQLCQHDLSDLRSGIKVWVDTIGEKWRIFVNVSETAMAIEDEFSISFDDQEQLYRNEDETTVSDIIESTNRVLNADQLIMNPDDLTARILKIVRKVFPNEPFKIRPLTRFSELDRNKEIPI